MTIAIHQYGSRNAQDVRECSANLTPEGPQPTTLGDLLDILGQNPPAAFPMLRSTCSLLTAYLDKRVGEITIDSVNETREGFRSFLEARKYKEQSVRSYVNFVRILLRDAHSLGWKPQEMIPEEWRDALVLAAHRQCADVVKHFARLKKKPRSVTIEDVDNWARMRIQQGLSYRYARDKKTWFWRVLRDCGCTDQTPISILREKNYGTPFDQLPPDLRREATQLLGWKKAEYAPERPRNGRHREVTSLKLKGLICRLYGFAVNIRCKSGITSLSQLVEENTVGDFTGWCINERRVQGQCLMRDLRLLSAAMHQHPSYHSLDLRWFKLLLGRLPIEPKSALRRRKAEKSLEFKVLELIPAKVHAERIEATKKGNDCSSQLAMEELLISWLIHLAWRQRNVRECRIGGHGPNLFKGKILPFMCIDKPEWVRQQEERNPEAEFWQFRFSCEQTKTGTRTGIEVHCVLPRPLIGPLEEYLSEFRPHLLKGTDPGTLFVNRAGNAMTLAEMTKEVARLTQKHGGRRVTPHLFRDIVAFAWLKRHPEDYLTLSKILWHADVKVTIDIYGSEYNESSGIVAMESWLEERQLAPPSGLAPPVKRAGDKTQLQIHASRNGI